MRRKLQRQSDAEHLSLAVRVVRASLMETRHRNAGATMRCSRCETGDRCLLSHSRLDRESPQGRCAGGCCRVGRKASSEERTTTAVAGRACVFNSSIEALSLHATRSGLPGERHAGALLAGGKQLILR